LPTELKYFYEKDEKVLRKKRNADAAIKPNLVKRKAMKVDLNKLAVIIQIYLFRSFEKLILMYKLKEYGKPE